MTTRADLAATEPGIRPAREADLLAVVDLEEQCFSEPWPFTTFQAHLDQPGFLVAASSRGINGFVVGSIEPGLLGPVAHIKDLAVDPRHRRLGIARRLLTTALARLHQSGAVHATLEVRSSNEPAQRLYRSLDFRPAKERPEYYADGETAIVMTRPM